jgi:hypothetical protein
MQNIPKNVMPKNNMPAPPRRLYDDCMVLNADKVPAWAGRRASKMRERYPVQNVEPVRGLALTAPVQPSIPSPLRGYQAL